MSSQVDVQDGADASKLLHDFKLVRVLNEDARSKSAILLGNFPTGEAGSEQAIVIMEKTHFSNSFYENLSTDADKSSSLSNFKSLGSNDVYHWVLGWMATPNTASSDVDAHVKLTIIRPATEAHILKYTEQEKFMVTETPETYAGIVEPWIKNQPVERIQWVYNILEKKKEADTILFERQGSSDGFIILPDLKWDQKTLSSLYLVAIVHDRSLRSMRDLKKEHIPLLRSIMQEGQRVAKEKFGLGKGESESAGLSKVRCFLHYQPTYYHLHVHLLSSDYTSHPGALVGQAHLLDDVIDLLEMGVDFTKRTLTYSLGSRSPLLALLQEQTSHRPTKVAKLTE
ncbi:scavenger mRNA decapping enzyme [Meira miltonrushii]|uniref:m7GpppX diphosphatase n=1 Tax=Meira miltonrushii TaxID=1280837 RepID=A0A316V2I3_9BASI|nr:scavenger mRNA decapping enzyme [Meira miltonrushii]PWN31767.1 scavenger mRNA decapping enzyme [Meira miltonrushii]